MCSAPPPWSSSASDTCCISGAADVLRRRRYPSLGSPLSGTRGDLRARHMPDAPWLMLVAFLVALCAGVPIAFVLALSALVFIWTGDLLPGEFFAQQMARGIDNFVLLAVPFFILVGYLMEANGMSVRLISLLLRGVGRMRGGLNVVMVLSMVIFSGISGSKMADVAAVGAVMVPAARQARQKAGRCRCAARGISGHGGDDPALHQSHHSRLRRESFDRRPVRGGIGARGSDGCGADDHRCCARQPGVRRVAGARGTEHVRVDRQRRRGVRPDRDHLRRLPLGLRDGDRNFSLRGDLRARDRRTGIPGADLARDGGGHHALGGSLRHGAVHRGRGAKPRIYPDDPADSACPRRYDGATLGLWR